jgi:hypothetical protein
VGGGDQDRPRLRRRVCQANIDAYKLIVVGMARTMFDRDTAPGAEPEDLLRLDISALVIPGQDAAHATSAARYLEECLPRAEYWECPGRRADGDGGPAPNNGISRSSERRGVSWDRNERAARRHADHGQIVTRAPNSSAAC